MLFCGGFKYKHAVAINYNNDACGRLAAMQHLSITGIAKCRIFNICTGKVKPVVTFLTLYHIKCFRSCNTHTVEFNLSTREMVGPATVGNGRSCLL